MGSSLDSNIQEKVHHYEQGLLELATNVPAYHDLRDFMQHAQFLDSTPARISVIRFAAGVAPDVADITEIELPEYIKTMRPGTLFVVENLSANVINLLGATYSVEYDFWREQINNANWFRLGEIEKHLPPLKSIQNESRYVRHHFISPRELILNACQSTLDKIEPEIGSTRVPRVAGPLQPAKRLPHRSFIESRPRDRLTDIALTRQHVSMWFDTGASAELWKIGIILLDPPFQAERTLGICQNACYRSFLPNSQADPERSYRTSFVSYLMQDEAIRKGLLPSPFIIVRDIYRIIASEWIVVNTCYQRELGSIEWNLGNGDFKLKHLQQYLHSMYHARRRINLYDILVKEAKDACQQHGRKGWGRHLDTKDLDTVENVASALDTDFDYVASLLQKNEERVAKNISLLVALISVAESRTAISNGSRIEALTVAAIIFLPFSLVSSIMNIGGDLAPGQPRHYIFWAVSVPFSVLLMVLYLFYSRSWSSG